MCKSEWCICFVFVLFDWFLHSDLKSMNVILFFSFFCWEFAPVPNGLSDVVLVKTLCPADHVDGSSLTKQVVCKEPSV